ncbi:MAG: dephospho-CoA kinase [Acidobacteria bacterium]|nr:dephospho-CoA kinase [Acidobacteriota bacterium]MCA1610069.1 dephospho-CoA kinase [Acidobacteriota bacterium]
MLRIGLTGGLASGKSTVARLLADRGAVVFDADGIVRALYERDAEGARAARELFGESILNAEGGVDRSRIAERVFSDPAARHALEERIHPLVGREIARKFEEASAAGAAVAVSEASQLLEARTESRYDRVLLVIAPEAERVSRWEKKGGDAEDARRRIASQIAPPVAVDRASDVIVNDGTLEDLESKVDAVYREWVRK